MAGRGKETTAAEREAWKIVLKGFEDALREVDDLPPVARARFLRCRAHVTRVLGDRPNPFTLIESR